MAPSKSRSIPPPAAHDPRKEILPIAERLGADPHTAGRGVTIAFLDAGFFAHPDLTGPRNRVIAYQDILSPRANQRMMPEPDASSWHGMMTSVVCAGNGALSEGRYKGLAHESEVVLVKVGTMSRVRHDDIREGIQWVIDNRQRLGIRVLNISCGGDYEASYLTDPLCRAAEDAVRAGITVVCAAGNAGHDPNHHPVVPPASTPAVIAVGGFDDAHGGPGKLGLYHSSYGPTIDGIQKPEVIAPAIWVAAPILPGTPTAAQAALLTALAKATDAEVPQILEEHHGVDPDLDAMKSREVYHVRNFVELKRRDQKVISKHYKHVDGTSFAAPIVASIVAQMLEANPALSPGQIKRILIETASRLPDVQVDRQGWGVVNPAVAVARARAARV